MVRLAWLPVVCEKISFKSLNEMYIGDHGVICATGLPAMPSKGHDMSSQL